MKKYYLIILILVNIFFGFDKILSNEDYITGDDGVIEPKEIKIIKVFNEESGELLYERL